MNLVSEYNSTIWWESEHWVLSAILFSGACVELMMHVLTSDSSYRSLCSEYWAAESAPHLWRNTAAEATNSTEKSCVWGCVFEPPVLWIGKGRIHRSHVLGVMNARTFTWETGHMIASTWFAGWILAMGLRLEKWKSYLWMSQLPSLFHGSPPLFVNVFSLKSAENLEKTQGSNCVRHYWYSFCH